MIFMKYIKLIFILFVFIGCSKQDDNGFPVYDENLNEVKNLNHFEKNVMLDLVIFSIGINDAYENDFSKESYTKNYDTLIQRIYSINPEAAILFTTNNDSYYHRKHPNKRVYEAKEAMVDLAKAKKLAVWDMFEIMGGLNSIQKWYSDDLAKKDLLHLNYKGYNLIGDLLFEAFMEAYKKYTTKNE